MLKTIISLNYSHEASDRNDVQRTSVYLCTDNPCTLLVLQDPIQWTNLNGSLHLNKAHTAISSYRKSVMIAKPWNFYASHCTGLHKHRDIKQRYHKHHVTVCCTEMIHLFDKETENMYHVSLKI